MRRATRVATILMLAVGLMTPTGARAGFDAGVAAHQAGQYTRALEEFADSATDGDPPSQFMLAEMYRRGQGVEVDMKLAAQWYRAAAEQGHPSAQNAVGTLYAMGQGLEQDDVQAYVWFSLATMLGNPVAEKNLLRAKELIGATNRKFADQIVQQYARLYVFPFRAAPGFQGAGEKMPAAGQ